MIRPNAFAVFFFLAVLICCRSKTLTPEQEELKLYNESLDQVITEYLMYNCLTESDGGFVDKINEDFYSKKMDSITYFRVADSLVAYRKTQLPKCIMEYSPLFYASLPHQKEAIQSSMRSALLDDFLREHFSSSSMTSVIDTLMQDGSLTWNHLLLPYIEFVAHDTSDQQHRYGNRGPVIALSKIYFNSDRDHSLLFFEFKGSANFQRGEIIFMEKKAGYWKAIAFHTVWIT